MTSGSTDHLADLADCAGVFEHLTSVVESFTCLICRSQLRCSARQIRQLKPLVSVINV
jgi:hypothetical protein